LRTLARAAESNASASNGISQRNQGRGDGKKVGNGDSMPGADHHKRVALQWSITNGQMIAAITNAATAIRVGTAAHHTAAANSVFIASIA